MKISFINNTSKLIPFGTITNFEENYQNDEQKSFYVIDRKGNYIKFHSSEEAENYVAVQKKNHKNHNLPNSLFFLIKKDSEIENQSKLVDSQKIQSLLSLYGENAKPHLGGRQPIEIYAIKTADDYRKYGSLGEFAEELNIKSQAISSSFRNGYKIHDYIMKKTSEIEDKNGFVDMQKILLILKNQPKRGKKEIPVYIINENGEAKKYSSIKDLANALNCAASRVSTDLIEGRKVRGNIVKYAKDLENESQELDQEKLQKVIEFYKNKALSPRKKSLVKKIKRTKKQEKPQKHVYVIHTKTKKVMKFENIEKLMEVFGINKGAIDYFLQNPKLSLRNFKIVFPSKIENINGKIDEEKVKKFIA